MVSTIHTINEDTSLIRTYLNGVHNREAIVSVSLNPTGIHHNLPIPSKVLLLLLPLWLLLVYSNLLHPSFLHIYRSWPTIDGERELDHSHAH